MPDLVKSTLNSDHVIVLATNPTKKMFMVVNPAQELVSYKICFTDPGTEKEGVCSIRTLDRAIEFYNNIKREDK